MQECSFTQSDCEAHISTWNLRNHSMVCSLDRDKDVNLTGFLAAVVYHFLLNWVDGVNYKKSASFDVSSSKQQFELYGKECSDRKYIESKNQMLIMNLPMVMEGLHDVSLRD